METFVWDRPTRFDAGIRERLDVYAHELLTWSQTYNLIGPSCTREELFHRHFRDGFLLLEHVAHAKQLADVGSGAGLPGIILALLAEQVDHICLIESRKKRVRFLNHCVRLLGLNHVTVFHGVAKEAGLRFGGVFDTVVSRGIGDLAYGGREVLPLLSEGGTYLTLKGLNYPGELQTYFQDKIAGFYETPRVVLEEAATGNRIVALTKKS
ncbi:MAG: 16S rRNA (guanine(527)-N(7))-methyltransferase RsmG [Magnetococcales bacterium]|nr:16S rRNA (guanine(527)-N(7))-methyltransferase RsmG [Magnetococcales bacterium]